MFVSDWSLKPARQFGPEPSAKGPISRGDERGFPLNSTASIPRSFEPVRA
jgi:hypothetical protein